MSDARGLDPGEGTRRDSPQVTRRRLLQAAGAGGLALAVAPITRWLPVLGAAAQVRGTRQRRLRRWAMVVDLRYCDGCVGIGKPPQCTESCIRGHFVPAGMQWIEVYRFPMQGGGTQFVPAPCMQCQNPPCVNVCPVGATFSTPEGVVLVDQGRCIGCRLCMAACPYQRRFFNWGEPVVSPASLLADYSPEMQAPARRGTVMKCDFCPERPRNGALPYCVDGCPNNALYYGDEEEDVATNGVVVVQLSRLLSENQAYGLKEHLGTQPVVRYIPGHGERVGRQATDTRDSKPVTWPWADGEG